MSQATTTEAELLAAAKAIHDHECSCGYEGEHPWDVIESREKMAELALLAAREASSSGDRS